MAATEAIHTKKDKTKRVFRINFVIYLAHTKSRAFEQTADTRSEEDKHDSKNHMVLSWRD